MTLARKRNMPARTIRCAWLLLAVQAGLLAWSATRHSPNVDEVGHFVAGVSHWELGRFDLYRVNPPLVRMLAALPVVLARPETDWTGYSDSPRDRPEFRLGRRFIELNGERSLWLLTLARWAVIPLSLLGGWVCFLWGRDLWGDRSGLLAMTLWCFCPNILAHGQMITPDAGATALGLLACYVFRLWLKEPSWPTTGLAGIALGLAELTKATWIVLFALFPALWLASRVREWWTTSTSPLPPGKGPLPSTHLPSPLGGEGLGVRGDRRAVRRHFGQLVVILLLAVYVLNSGYGFEGTFTRLKDYEFVSRSLGGTQVDAPAHGGKPNRFADTWLGEIPVPLPKNFVSGIDVQKRDFERGFRSYLRGEWKHGGWWYYYVYALLIKTPLGTWLLGLLAGLALWWIPACRPGWREELVLIAPAAITLVLVSSQTGFNHHLRYVLAVFPFAFIWLSRVALVLSPLSPPGGEGSWREVRGHQPPPLSPSGGEGSGVRGDQPRRSPMHNSPSPLGGEGRGEGSVAASPPAPTWRSRALRAATLAALIWSITSSLWYYPHSLSYFNESVGGPTRGHEHLVDSNIDWGQDLPHLKQWLDAHPEARPLGLAYFGMMDPRVIGIEFTLPPKGPIARADFAHPTPPDLGPRPGWYAVSVCPLRGHRFSLPDGKGGEWYCGEDYFTYFQHFQPVARAGYSIDIYHVTLTETNRVRRKLGLVEL